MKKLYTLLGLMIAFLCGGLTANAQTVYVEIDNPDNFYLTYTGDYSYTFKAGTNELSSGGTLWINTNGDGIEMRMDDGEWTTEELSIAINADNDGKTFRLTSRIPKVEETLTLSFDFGGVNPSDVISSFTYCGEPVDAENYAQGEHTFTLGENDSHDFKLVTTGNYYFAAVQNDGRTVKYTKDAEGNISYDIKDARKNTSITFKYVTPITVKKANFTFGYGKSNASAMIAQFMYGDSLNQSTEVPETTYAAGTNEVSFIDPLENTYELITTKAFDIASINGTAIEPTDYYGTYKKYVFTLAGDDEVIFNMNAETITDTPAKAQFTFNYGSESMDDYIQFIRCGYEKNKPESGEDIAVVAGAAGTKEVEFGYPSQKSFAVILKKDKEFLSATLNGEPITPSYWQVAAWKAYYFDLKDGDEVVFSAVNLDATSKANFTFDFNGASADDIISQFRKGCDINKTSEITGTSIDKPVAGTKEFEFTASENTFGLVCMSGKEFKVATVNGETITPGTVFGSYPYYLFTVNDGDEVVFSMKEEEEPAADPQITFVYENDDLKTVIKRIVYNNAYINDFKDGITVTSGSKVGLDFDTYGYKNVIITANGEDLDLSSTTVYFYPTEDTEIHVYGKKLGKEDITVNIDNPNNVKFLDGRYAYNSNEVQLQAGDNTVSLTEVTVSAYPVTTYGFWMTITEANDGKIVSVKDEEGNDLTKSGSAYCLENGTKVFIVTEDPEVEPEEFEVYLYINNTDNLVFKDKSGYDLIADNDLLLDEELDNGYQTVTFISTQNPFYFSGADVYVNGEKKEKMGQATYDVTLEDGDFVMVFQGGTPTTHTVSIDLPADVEALVKKHHTEEVTDLSAIEMYEGTELRIEPTGDKKIWVYVPSTTPAAPARSLRDAAEEAELITDNGDGSFTVKVNEKTANLRVSHNDPTGINEIISEIDENAEVYNLQGIRVKADSNRLPEGIYIIDGKKVMLGK